MRTVVVVQARTGSSRLPGKILMPLAGAPLLQRMLERVRAATTPFELVVATTTDASDDAVAELGAAIGVPVYRGHPTDLLDRHVGAARAASADAVVKIPSDCPVIDPAAIDAVLGVFHERAAAGEVDFVSNLHPASWPDGHDVEAMTMDALEQAWREATKPHEREHTTPFLWDQPGRFRCTNVRWAAGRDLSMSHRMTIDYPEDYAFLRAVYDELYRPERPIFTLEDILTLLERRPDIGALNARYAGVNWYRHHLADLRTVRAEETRCL
jgi:spore coat polysaccharide biosynthesis protein SpsF